LGRGERKTKVKNRGRIENRAEEAV
jgi:hypothetical protein